MTLSIGADLGWIYRILFFGLDRNFPARLIPDALCRNVRMITKFNVHDTALASWHGFEHLAAVRFNYLFSHTPRQLSELVFAA